MSYHYIAEYSFGEISSVNNTLVFAADSDIEAVNQIKLMLKDANYIILYTLTIGKIILDICQTSKDVIIYERSLDVILTDITEEE